MSEDARFEDSSESPLRLKALDAEDLQVLSALVQDAVFPASEMAWQSKDRRFAILLNRFRWEDASNADKRKRAYERVQSLLAFENVIAVRSQGVQKGESDTILSLLAVTFEAGEDGTGSVFLTFAGDGVLALEVEAIEAQLRDVTRPYVAPSRKMPGHD